jgi:hypothetical protein
MRDARPAPHCGGCWPLPVPSAMLRPPPPGVSPSRGSGYFDVVAPLAWGTPAQVRELHEIRALIEAARADGLPNGPSAGKQCLVRGD